MTPMRALGVDISCGGKRNEACDGEVCGLEDPIWLSLSSPSLRSTHSSPSPLTSHIMPYTPHASDKIGHAKWPQWLKDEYKRWHWELLDRDLEEEPWNVDARLFRRANVMNARGKNNNTTQNQPPNRGNTSSPGAYAPNMSAAPPSPSISTTTTTNNQAHLNNQGAKKVPIFFREEYATLIVKGNFMTLAAQPHQVEIGEWLAHQRW